MSQSRRIKTEITTAKHSSGWDIAGFVIGSIMSIATVGIGIWSAKKVDGYEKDRKLIHRRCQNQFVSAQELLTDDELEEGDLIEFKRTRYQHWAIYVGNGEVVHLKNTGRIGSDYLIRVAGKGLCRVNLLEQAAKNRGLKRRKSRKEIVNFAKKMSGVSYKVSYNVYSNNCEHFVTSCFYGTGFSEQQDILDNNVTIRAVAKLRGSSSACSPSSSQRLNYN